MRQLLAVLGLLTLSVSPASAHKLKVFATVESGVISGYGFFVGGGRPQGAEVVIKDRASQQLYRGETDTEGRFTFKPAGASDYTVSVNTREGHMAETQVAADRFGAASAKPDALRAANAPTAPASAADPNAPAGLSQAGAADIDRIVDTAVARQVRPLLERIEALDDRLRLADAVAGVCMILGLGGIGLWATTRRDVSRSSDPT